MLDACVNKIYNQCHIHDPKEAKEKVKYFCDDSWPLFFGRIARLCKHKMANVDAFIGFKM